MTLEEAQKVASVLGGADGGCQNCVSGLAGDMEYYFPEYKWTPVQDGPFWEVIVSYSDAGQSSGPPTKATDLQSK